MKYKTAIAAIVASMFMFTTSAQEKTGSFQCRVNGKEYKLDLATADFSTDIQLYGVFQMVFRIPSSNNRFGSVQIVTDKLEPGNYKLGCCNSANYNEPYDSYIQWRLMDYQSGKSFSTHGGGNTSGTITIERVEDFYVWGKFDAYAQGEQISGKFEHVYVHDLTQMQFIEKKKN